MTPPNYFHSGFLSACISHRALLYALLSLVLGLLVITQSGASSYFSDTLIPVADLGPSRAVGLSVSSDNRVFISFPSRTHDGEVALAEIKQGKLLAFPDSAWNSRKGQDRQRFVSPQALHVDAANNLWVLDSRPAAGPLAGNTEAGYFKLVKVNLANGQVERVFEFDGLNKLDSGLNDVVVDLERKLAYLSDPGQGAIVVLDLDSGATRTVLASSAATKSDSSLVLNYDGRDMRDPQGKPFRSHINGIALSKDNRFLYFKAINALDLYRIETRWLADSSLDDATLDSKIERLGRVGVSHGLTADARDTIYLTSSLDYSIKYLTSRGELKTLVQDSRLLWPDSLGIGTDGFLYLTVAQFQKSRYWNGGVDGTVYPFKVYKVKLPE